MRQSEIEKKLKELEVAIIKLKKDVEFLKSGTIIYDGTFTVSPDSTTVPVFSGTTSNITVGEEGVRTKKKKASTGSKKKIKES